MINDDEILERLCKKEEVECQTARKLKAKIFPLLEEAHMKLGYRFDKAFFEQRKGMEIRLANSKTILLLLRRLKPQFFSINERTIISLHLEYLMVVEGLFTSEINFLIFTLIANGHDLYSTQKGKYVKTLSDIEEVNLGFKLKFLREHEFDTLIANKVDIKLRNSVAHLFYEINENGTIIIRKRKIAKKDYERLYVDLRNISYSLHLINLVYYRRFAAVKAFGLTLKKLGNAKNLKHNQKNCSNCENT